MFLDHVLRQYVTGATLMLDLCAAPGGKSTCALGALPPGSALVCNEPVRQRAAVLAENIQKWGAARGDGHEQPAGGLRPLGAGV